MEGLPSNTVFAYPGVRDNRSTLNTKTGYDDDGEMYTSHTFLFYISVASPEKNRLNHCKYIVASNDLLWVILVPRRIHHYFFEFTFFVLETKVKNVPILQI